MKSHDMKSSTPKGIGPSEFSALRDLLKATAASVLDKSETVVLSIPAPEAPLSFLLRTCPSRDAFLWIPPEGPRIAGVGAAFAIAGEGEHRFKSLRERSTSLWKTLAEIRAPGCSAPPPVLFGGLAFEAEQGAETPWEDFPDGAFLLPRWCYGRTESGAWLSLALRGQGDLARIDAYLVELSNLLEGETKITPEEKTPAVCAARSETSLSEWSALVEGIRRGIEEGLFSKVVAALRTDLDLGAAIDPLAVFDRLDRAYPDCHRFLVKRGETVLLGASPERLVRRRGREIATEALAGSIDAAATAEGNRMRAIQLLESRKDLGEHELVVEAIRRKLEPLCSELRVPARPQIRELPHVLHLHTPMEGVLSRETHVLDLAAVLHPTPSVGGVPTSDAVRWIVENEPHRRGWYAGPVGWFDGEGNGDLAVAIRSGVLRGRNAYVYAGAGIVRDSNVSREHEETRTKQRPLLRALGVVD